MDTRRHLLNTEKMVFHTSSDGCIQWPGGHDATPLQHLSHDGKKDISDKNLLLCPPLRVVISVVASSVRAHGEPYPTHVFFDLALRPLVFGLVPRMVVGLFISLVVVVVIALRFVHPRLVSHFMAVGKSLQNRHL